MVRNVEAHGTHGLSVTCTRGVGSNYTFESSVIYDSLIGCRFKGKSGTTCNITDVHWRNIRVHNVSYPIHFIEDYWDPESTAPPPSTGLAAYTGRFTYENISGVIAATIGDGSCVSDPCWYYTSGRCPLFLQEYRRWTSLTQAGQSPSNGVYLLCKDAVHCRSFRFSNIDLRTAVSSFGRVDGDPDANLRIGPRGADIECRTVTLLQKCVPD